MLFSELQISDPGWLLVVPFLLICLWLIRRYERDYSDLYSLIILLLTGLCLTLAATRPVLKTTSTRQHHIIAVDVSDSTDPDPEQIVKTLQNYSRRTTGNKMFSVLLFGNNSTWLAQRQTSIRDLTVENVKRGMEGIDAGNTSLQHAIEQSLQVNYPDETTRILLLSDGQFPLEEIYISSSRLNTAKIPIFALPTRSSNQTDVWLESVRSPSLIRPGSPFEVQTTIRSTGTYPTRIALTSNEQTLHQKEIEVSPDQPAVVRFLIDPAEQLHREYTLSLHTGKQEWTRKNNRIQFGVREAGKIDILWLGHPETYRAVTENLSEKTFEITHSRTPGNLHMFDVVVFSGPASDLSRGEMEDIRRNWKKGFLSTVMIGNRDTFASGGWGRTPVEKTMPVKMYPPDQLSIVFVFDVSGSMGQTVKNGGEGPLRIEVTRNALLGSFQFIRRSDRVGLISYATDAKVNLPLQKFGTGMTIRGHLESLEPGGGTRLAPAVSKGINLLNKTGSQQKYLFIFSDSQLDEDKKTLRELGERARNNSIRMVAISTNRHGKQNLLRELLGHSDQNRLVYYSDFSTVTKILSRELKRLRHLTRSEGGKTVLKTQTDYLPSRKKDLPATHGHHHRVTPKPIAESPLLTERDEVLVSAWNPQGSRSLAITQMIPAESDLPRDVQKDWLSLLNRGLRWSSQSETSQDWSMRTEVQNDKILVFLEKSSGSLADDIQVSGTLVSPNRPVSQKRNGVRTGANQFRFEYNRPEEGLYRFRATVRVEGNREENIEGPITVPFSPEYLHPGINRIRLASLAQKTGGRQVTETNPVRELSSRFQKGTDIRPLSPYFLYLSLAGLVLLILPRLIGLFVRSESRANSD